jgi:hypothetical protein
MKRRKDSTLDWGCIYPVHACMPREILYSSCTTDLYVQRRMLICSVHECMHAHGQAGADGRLHAARGVAAAMVGGCGAMMKILRGATRGRWV